jgi:hypothetical protein
MADKFRSTILATNTGGVAVLLGLANAYSCHPAGWMVLPLVVFVLGLLLTFVSLALQKHKALQRQRDVEAGREPTAFKSPFYWRNQTWDFAALAAFLAGVLLGLGTLSRMQGC